MISGKSSGHQAVLHFFKRCQMAYMLLRKKSKYLVGLFRSMVLAEIPELTVDSVAHLEITLAVGLDDKTAERSFIDKFMEVNESRS